MTEKSRILKTDIVVVGAGVAGLSTAYHLAKNSKLSIVVLEQENILGGHASGRNAGMIRQTVPDEHIARLAVLGRRALAQASKRGWKKFDFAPMGSLLLAGKDKVSEIEKIKKLTHRLGLSTRWLSAEEIRIKAPLLGETHFERALFCPSDALLDNQKLLLSFQDQLKRLGVKILLGEALVRIQKTNEQFQIETSSRTIMADKVVNAAGAWCAMLAQKIGAQSIPLQPYRRHLYYSALILGDCAAWPFVWDLSRDFYFRPDQGRLLLSACDKALASRQDLRQRKETTNPKIRKALLKKMNAYSESMKKLSIESEKSGLRTMTPDGKFVIGQDAKLTSFYWVAGLGGHGVTTCFSVGKLASDIILEKKFDVNLARAFSPKRFRGA